MSKIFEFWGQKAIKSDDPRGAIGVTINGRNLRADHWDAAQRIAAAGSAGLAETDEGGVPLADISFLQTAGIEVRDVGFRRYAINLLPEPQGYIHRDLNEPAQQAPRGQYGSSGIPHDPYSRR